MNEDRKVVRVTFEQADLAMVRTELEKIASALRDIKQSLAHIAAKK